MPALATSLPPAPIGLVARYFGAGGGSTNRYYWVRANYPSGKSDIAGPVLVTTPAALSANDQVLIGWDPSPGAMSYDVLQTSSTTLPTVSAAVLNKGGITPNAYTDKGDTLATYVPFLAPELGVAKKVAHAVYSFAVDGGAATAITPVKTAVIPKNAIISGGNINVIAAITSDGSATLAVGTTAGSAANSLLVATAKATLITGYMVNIVPTQAVPIKMSAAGSINITVATAALTAGIVEIFVEYVVAESA